MKILIIEDDISLRNVLRIGLEEMSHVVDEAENGEKGSYLARVNKYDLILLDNVLPKKMGRQVCQEIRKSGIHTPILLLSAKSEVNSKIDLLDSGADDYMTKPFSFLELQSRIKVLARRPQKIEDFILSANHIELNRNKAEIKIRGKKVYFTRKEFLLLELLMKNYNDVITRSMIMEKVWEMQVDPFSNTVETHIRNVRVKIKDVNKKIIVNIPGRGYKFQINKTTI